MNRRQLLYFLLSFLVVAGAQPDWSALACILASAVGYAVFWKGMLLTTSRKKRFLQATIWFAAVQAVQVSWFATDRYVGAYIYIILAILFLAIGVQFGLISLFVNRLTILRMLGISGGWALFEGARLFVLSGYSWNPTGIALSGTLYGMQMASVTGVFGMSFWIFFTNLLALKVLTSFSWSRVTLCLATALTPYLFGWAHVSFHQKQMAEYPEHLSTLIVQTSLYPEYKLSINGSQPLPPHLQWERILSLLFPYGDYKPDLIVFSEAVVPYGADFPIYPLEVVEHAFTSFFDQKKALPPSTNQLVGNTYWAQAVANQFSADVVIGLEDYERGVDGHVLRAYNAAFLFRPISNTSQRYEKRVLVPMGEYIPFDWCRNFLAKYGIEDSFTAGEEAKVFQTSRVPIGLSICYEETYGHLMRESRLNGAALLINLSNDVWYPRSRLPMVHFFHGRSRKVPLKKGLIHRHIFLPHNRRLI